MLVLILIHVYQFQLIIRRRNPRKIKVGNTTQELKQILILKIMFWMIQIVMMVNVRIVNTRKNISH